jgi:hypothetical protein
MAETASVYRGHLGIYLINNRGRPKRASFPEEALGAGTINSHLKITGFLRSVIKGIGLRQIAFNGWI